MAKIFHGQLSLYTEGGWGKKLVESGKTVKKGPRLFGLLLRGILVQQDENLRTTRYPPTQGNNVITEHSCQEFALCKNTPHRSRPYFYRERRLYWPLSDCS
jgi:hypothetical protein